MNDTDIVRVWSTLEPDARRRARIETRLFEWLEARETSIAGEWLGLLKVEPLTALAYASIGGVWLVLVTPIGWMTGWMIS